MNNRFNIGDMMKLDQNNNKIIVAMDFDNFDQAMALASQLDPQLCHLKVGKELFTRCGPVIIDQMQAKGFDIFLDLKFHDIPNTVAKAVRAAADLGVWMVNVHVSGGRHMLDAARDSLDSLTGPTKPLLIGVTVLTSLDEQDLLEVGFNTAPIQLVERMASLAQACGLDGVVCSPQEVEMLKSTMGPEFLLVTPGIRPASASVGDQKRIMTPEQAVQAGSDYLVIGRPITQSRFPLEALRSIILQLKA